MSTSTFPTAAAATRAIKAENALIEGFDFDVLHITPDDNSAFNPAGKYTPEQCVLIGAACAQIAQQINGASWALKNAREFVRCKRLDAAAAHVASAARCRARAEVALAEVIAAL